MGSIADKLFAVARMLDDPKQSAHVAQSCYAQVTEVWS
jgi:hypothetical protein